MVLPPGLVEAVRATCLWDGNRATSYLYGDREWPPGLAQIGPALLDELDALLGVRFSYVAVQGYRNGTGTTWHADTPFDAQAILSLGVTRTFGIREVASGEEERAPVHHGDLLYMPPGFQLAYEHALVEEQDELGERFAVVFRTPK